MNRQLVLRVLGAVIVLEGAAMLPALLVALYDGSYEWKGFLLSIVICVAVGLLLMRRKPEVGKMAGRDGMATVALSWVVLTLFGALPAFFSGAIPSYVDSFFECAAGFSTTGASIMTDIEAYPRGLLLWRSTTQWIGGMGVLVLTLALLPKLGAGSVFLLRAENPGPIKNKIVPKLGQMAKILYAIYAGLTALELILLKIAGMSWYDSVIHAFSTMSSGGFSTRNLSIAAFDSVPITVIVLIFMFLTGVNFSLHFCLLRGDFRSLRRDEEFRLYWIVLAAATAIIALDILPQYADQGGNAVLDALFQTVSLSTSTGFTTADFNLWPTLSKAVLVLLMLLGGCSGSTAGGLKVLRALILAKSVKREFRKMLHPRAVTVVRMNGKAVEDGTLFNVAMFFFLYAGIILIAFVVVAIDGFDVTTSFTAALSAISNMGPGLGAIGPMGNYADFSDLSKVVLSVTMLVGRLEVFPILLLFMPSLWKRG